jgi:hypothetical protein
MRSGWEGLKLPSGIELVNQGIAAPDLKGTQQRMPRTSRALNNGLNGSNGSNGSFRPRIDAIAPVYSILRAFRAER